MKNAGLAGAITLCGIGLIMIGLGNSVSTPRAMAAAPAVSSSVDPNEICIPRCDAGKNGELPYCVAKETEIWFEMVPRQLCAGDGYGLSTIAFSGGDLNGDRIPDSLSGGIRYWSDGAWSGDSTDLFAFSIELSDGVAKTTYTPIQIDWSLFVLDPESDTSVRKASNPIDIDGDGRRDLVVRSNSDGITNWFWLKNITAGSVLTADVNVDGRVDGIDLALVLGQWTG